MNRALCPVGDTAKVEALFAGWEETMILSCLQRVMGTIYVNDPEKPASAMAVLADFVFLAGEPDRALVEGKPEGFRILVPQNKDWAELIEACFPDAERYDRWAIRKDTRFDRERLAAMAAALPAGCELRRIDGELYDLCLADALFQDGVKHFGSKEEYLRHGRGFAVVKDGRLASIASSYSVYRGGVEIEIDTAEAERRKGLASAAGAALILSCLDDGLYPSWDAANMASVHLAEKLGYELSHAYHCYGVK
ncbi:MAG: GNAT family N-acetyltransferase [Oscillospiraceae bacterium]|nr:GNAT family N-acetyltransferase [Oscillospiraceae bacterium]